MELFKSLGLLVAMICIALLIGLYVTPRPKVIKVKLPHDECYQCHYNSSFDEIQPIANTAKIPEPDLTCNPGKYPCGAWVTFRGIKTRLQHGRNF